MKSSLIAWGLLALALGAWCGCGALIFLLQSDRTAYADAAAKADDASLRQESAARLHARIQSTETERGALESLAGISILDAVKIIEAAGKDAGATSVSIGEATPLATSLQKLTTVAVTANVEGTFASVMRAESLLETLPIPASLEQFDIIKMEKTWHLTAHLKVVAAADK